MKRYASTGNRDQVNISCLDDMISEDNAVRAIDAIVESMDIPSLKFKYSETAETGRMPYNPVDMFKLYAYSYFNGLRASRKIEKETHRNIEVMVRAVSTARLIDKLSTWVLPLRENNPHW